MTKTNRIQNAKEMGAFVKKRRKELKSTQQVLANLANLSHNGISQIELGNKDVKLSTLLKLSKFLGFHLVLEVEE